MSIVNPTPEPRPADHVPDDGPDDGPDDVPDHVPDHVPYDDPAGYARRWGRLGADPAALIRAADADRIGFVADHLPSYDRTDGTVVVLLDGLPDGRRVVQVVAGLPDRPDPGDRRAVLTTVVMTVLGRAPGPGDGTAAPGKTPPVELGLVVHRRGPDDFLGTDRAWGDAVTRVADHWGLGILGVAIRTESGALLRLIEPATGRVA